MYDFHDSIYTDIFIKPSFLSFCTQKAPWISSKNRYLGAYRAIIHTWSICALQDLPKNVSWIVKIVHSAAAKLAVLSIYSSSSRGQYFRAFLVVFQIFFSIGILSLYFLCIKSVKQHSFFLYFIQNLNSISSLSKW